jgi:voltage-gated potassium channel
MGSFFMSADRKSRQDRVQQRVLEQVEDWLETPMFLLGLAWLVLLVIDLTRGLTPLLEAASTGIWIVFIVDFAVRLVLAPRKWAYLRQNWLTVIALMLPALRVFRVARVVRVLRFGRATRSLQFMRLVTSFNRGLKTLRTSLGKYGFGYVVALTVLVTLLGAAGMFAFERDQSGGLSNYGDALWFTAMLMTTSGSEYWPKSAEGRTLCFLLALYAFAVFGYVTATLATFLIGHRDEAKQEPAEDLESSQLRQEIASLRGDIARLLDGRSFPQRHAADCEPARAARSRPR